MFEEATTSKSSKSIFPKDPFTSRRSKRNLLRHVSDSSLSSPNDSSQQSTHRRFVTSSGFDYPINEVGYDICTSCLKPSELDHLDLCRACADMLLSHHLDMNGDSNEVEIHDWEKSSPIVIDDDDDIKRSRTPILIEDNDFVSVSPIIIRDEDYNRRERSDFYVSDSPNYWWETRDESPPSSRNFDFSYLDASVEDFPVQERGTTALTDCAICCDSLPLRNFTLSTTKCSHSASICRACLNEYIIREITDKGNINIRCPDTECQMIFAQEDIRDIVDEDVFFRFEALSLRFALQQVPDFRWCKNGNCPAGQIHEGGLSVPIMTCTACNARSCFVHDLPIHSGLQCDQCKAEEDEANAEKEEANKKKAEKASEGFLQQQTKPCPKCKSRIIKNGGCDHMTCKAPNCRHEFCWV
ncbi:343_t:CDS:2 [Paraglomus brasilianum]|uniref:RBR-type E3 ubiquitin transferase n=1 Tax=Paraglomus brasilianum TaxID=144538 RepID=A0A9N9AVU5_9GLOM|nr:343_t:CDS:2 [Paraglomus brasilianum]